MAYISDQELNELREKVDIVEIISNYIPLTPKGKNFFGVCPFHADHSPSMSVSREKQMYKCFSCGAAGNVFTFIQNYENVPFYEAVQLLANKVGIFLAIPVKSEQKEKYTKEYEMMEIALKYYQNNLNTSLGEKAKKYLYNRNLEDEVIKDFEIGYAASTHTLNKLLLKKGYTVLEMQKLGLVSTSKEEYDIFFDRVMIPLYNLEGQVVGFTGRALDDTNTPKYLGSKESIIYKKGNLLFNYHRARESIKLNKEIILVEGNMDAIRLYASGIKNVVALMGTALTKEQIQIIKKLRCKVILMLDNDTAGEKATYDDGLLLEQENIDVLVVRLSGEKDPDSYIIKNGAEAITNNIKKAIPLQDFKLNYLKKDKNLQNTDDLVKYVKMVIADLNKKEDELLKEVTLKKLSEEYNLSYEILKKQLDKSEAKQVIKEKKEEKKKKTSYQEAIYNVLYYMMNDSIYIKMYMKKLGYIAEQKYRLIASEIIYYYELNKYISLADFITYSETSKLKEEIMDIIKNVNYEELNEKVFLDSISLIKKKRKENEIKILKEEIKNTMDESKKEEILQKIIDLKIGSVKE